ncbi:putative hydroxypyruvate isomerase isoform X4 [Moschus berezovskii]|uniref:putative hydroxypyruvate isomerase isoform X4 n=1 Tax=Moschus berezovskii TaxID=68408 RepID=UPI002444E100|nr:putative hydroxypyruvate isomerase isoform X4 [Moschus berezovskii]
MAPLRFSANLSWLFPELSGFPARLRAAGSSGFEAAEIGWAYAEPPEALARAAREAGLRIVLINTPPGAWHVPDRDRVGQCGRSRELRPILSAGDREKGENGLGAVPGRQAAFREGLEQAVLYAKALGCSRIHLMAGRVPKGADRAAVRGEMEIVFLENLRHAAEVLAQENLVGLLEPINTRITDPGYFLDTPQQAAAILQKVGRPNLQLQMDLFHWQIMDGNLTGNVREFLPIVDEGYRGFVGCEYQPRGEGGLSLAPGQVLWRDSVRQGLSSSAWAEMPRALLPSGNTVEGLSWLRAYWELRGRPQAGQ